MGLELNIKHLFVLMGFFLVISLFGISMFKNDSSTSLTGLTGYVVMEQGIKVSTEKMDSNLVEEINSGNVQPRVVVILNSDIGLSGDSRNEINDNQEQLISELQQAVDVVDMQQVDSNLEDENLNQADFKVTHKFEDVNAISGEIKDAQALVELTKNSNVKKILLDYPVTVDLDLSAPLIGANYAWNISINGTVIDGSGETACIIDTGVDYTHSALGNCSPSRYVLTGEVTDLMQGNGLVPIESDHSYIDNFDHTWEITFANFSSIAVHFTNISLEKISNAGDTLDRIYIYDKFNRTIAVYKGDMADVWSPAAEGDTIYVRLVTDSSVVGYGFLIDQVINGTTNMTMDWSTCNKVLGGWDTYNNDPDPKDDHQHGTHVAGIIGSTDFTYRGVAYGANVAAVKALSASGGGYSSDVVAGIEWCTSNAERLNISVISMSLGCDGGSCVHNQNYCNDDILADVINNAYDKNIAVFIASGNSGWTNGISSPACIEKAIPVGGINAAGSVLYNRGNLLKIIAPATTIRSTVLNNRFADSSGTSMATPHAAATALLMNQYWKKAYGARPSVDVLENKLSLTGLKVYDSGTQLNFSRIDAFSLLKPVINFTNESVANGYSGNRSSFLITVSADVPLVSGLFELNYTNGTNMSIINYTMNGSNGVGYYHLNNLRSGNYSYKVYAYGYGGMMGQSEVRTLTLFNVTIDNNTVSNETANETTNTSNITNVTLIGPVIGAVSYSPEVVFMNTSITFNVTVNDTNLNTSAVVFSYVVNSGNWTNQTMNLVNSTNGTVFNYTLVNGSVVNYTFVENVFNYNLSNSSFGSGNTSRNLSYMVYAWDLDGNLNNSLVYNITILPLNISESNSSANSTEVVNSTVSNVTNITLPANGSMLELGENISFSATSNLTNTTNLWLFGDGTNASGLNVSKAYNVMGNYTVVFNTTNSSVSYVRNISVIVNDTLGPVVNSITYDTSVHLSQDVYQRVNISFADYSGISNVSFTWNGTEINFTNKSGNNYTWKFNGFKVGGTNFRLNLTDNSTFKHSNFMVYSFAVVSCNDTVKNGDETGIDCGGACAVCANTTTSSTSASSTSSSSSATASSPVEAPVINMPIVEEKKQTTELAIQNLASGSSSSDVVVEKKVVNWTAELKEAKIEQKQTMLYILGMIVVGLACLYTFVIKKD